MVNKQKNENGIQTCRNRNKNETAGCQKKKKKEKNHFKTAAASVYASLTKFKYQHLLIPNDGGATAQYSESCIHIISHHK